MMKRLTFLSLLLCAGLAASAQDGAQAPAAQKPAVSAMPLRATPQSMAEELGLSPEQVERLDAIDRQHQDLIREMQRQNLDPQAKRTRTTELRDRKQAEIKAVMTAEQWAQWLQMKQQQRDASLRQYEEQRKQQAQPKE